MKQIITISLALLTGFSGLAQTKDTLRFTLTGAVIYAMQNNPQLKSAKLDEINNEFKIKEVRSSVLPQITASGNGTDNFERATQLLPGDMLGQPGTTIPVKFGTRFVYSGGVQLNQVLYNPSLNTGLNAAKASQGLYKLQSFKTTEDLIFNIANAFVQMKMVERQKELVEGNLDRMKTLIQITNAQFKEGIIKKVDVDQLKVNNTNLLTELSNVENNYAQLENSMKLLLNIDVNQPVIISDANENRESVSLQLNPEENTDLNIIEKQIELQQLNTKNIKDGYMPTLSFVANYNRQWQTNQLFKGSATSGFNAGYYGLNLSIPIFDGNKKRNQIAQSNIALKQIQLQKEYLTKNIQTQFKTATNDLSQNQKVLKAQQENMKFAEDLYNVATLSYTEGISALSELINAENGLREAQSQYLTAMLQTNIAELETMRTSGQLSQLIKTKLPK